MSVDPGNDADWLAFRGILQQLSGIPLDQYKEPQMRRRVAALMPRLGVESWAALGRAIAAEPPLLKEIRDTLTINVSEFWRQPERFAELRERWLPARLALRPSLRIWSAGCSIGCEPYSLAMILADLDPSGAHTIIATDIDLPALARARSGSGYLPSEVRGVPAELAARFLTEEPAGAFRIDDQLKRRVAFREHNLLTDPYPANLDLILCRNVVIYLTEPAKQQIYAGFAKALRPGGLLFVGGSEVIFRSNELGLQPGAPNMYLRAA